MDCSLTYIPFQARKETIFKKPSDLESVFIKCQCILITTEILIEVMGHYILSGRPLKTLFLISFVLVKEHFQRKEVLSL